jgi:hypothetical protein
MTVRPTSDEALVMLRTSDRLPWPDGEVATVLHDSLEALELLVDLEARTDDELRSLLTFDDGAVAPLEVFVGRCLGTDEGQGR